jgi:hypothetical protein
MPGYVLAPGHGEAFGFHGSTFAVTSADPARALVITGPPRLDQQIAAHGEPGTGPGL